MKTRLIAALTLGAALVGCGAGPAPTAAQHADRPFTALEADALRYPVPRFSRNEADVLYDMACFEAMEQAVLGAKRTIAIDYYIFGGPTAGRLAELLIAKRREGVEVRVLLDAAMGRVPTIRAETLPVYRKLVEAGVPVAFHADRPLAPRTAGRMIDHNKYFVVDEELALVGSMNLSKKFYRYHDLMIRAAGPVAVDLARQFDLDWYHARHPEAAQPAVVALPSEAPPAAAPEGPGLVRLVGTGLGRKTARESLMPLIAGARESIHVQMHELGDSAAIEALIAARDRGVDVKILLDPGVVDPFVPVIHKAPRGIVNAVAIARLLEAGMNVRTYMVDDRLTTAHMKSAVFDGAILYAGSANWTGGGFGWVGETDLEIRGGRAPGQAEAMFAHDWVQRSMPAEPPSATALALCKLYHLSDGIGPNR